MLLDRTRQRLQRLIHPRTLAIASVVGLALLLVDNVYWLVRNQIRLSCVYKVCASPRSIEAVARRSTNPQIAAVANWYLLGKRIPNARLAVPPRTAQLWHLEHVARLRVEVSDEPFLIDPRQVRRLQKTSAEHRELRWWRSKPVKSHLYLRYDPRDTDYVMAETGDPGGPVFVMPRSEYAAVAAR